MTKRIESIPCPVCGREMRIEILHERNERGECAAVVRCDVFARPVSHKYFDRADTRSRAAAVRRLKRAVAKYREQVEDVLSHTCKSCGDKYCIHTGKDWHPSTCNCWKPKPGAPRVLEMLEVSDEPELHEGTVTKMHRGSGRYSKLFS